MSPLFPPWELFLLVALNVSSSLDEGHDEGLDEWLCKRKEHARRWIEGTLLDLSLHGGQDWSGKIIHMSPENNKEAEPLLVFSSWITLHTGAECPFLCRQRNPLTFKLRILKEQKDWSENTLASEGLIWGKGWQTIPFGAKGKMQLETYHLVACLGIFQTYYWLISKLRINLEEEWWIPNFSNHTLPNKL